MSKKQLYENEIGVLAQMRKSITDEKISKEALAKEFNTLCDHYEELLDQSKLITKVSDKLQNKLNTVNEALAGKNIELQDTIDELTKARIGKKAATITFGLAVVLFLISEGVLDPVIETIVAKVLGSNHTESGLFKFANILLWATIFGKLIMAILLKPLESFIENYLLKRAHAAAKKLELSTNTITSKPA